MMKKNIRIGIAGAVLIVLMIAAGVFIEQKMKLEEPVFLTGGMLPEKTVLLIRMMSWDKHDLLFLCMYYKPE